MFSKKINFNLLYILILIPYIFGLFIPLMELDSAQHATMAMRMNYENDFLNLIKSHKPYLDKPHMHYWLAALSFKLFGVSEFSYRLPAFCLLVLGGYSTYKLGKLLYNNVTGNIAALIFFSSQTIILSAHDVRTDAVLTGAFIFSLWKFIAFIKNEKIIDILLSAIFLGIAFSTKGLIAVIVFLICVFCYLVYERKWKSIFNAKILIGIIGFIISIIPVLYAYYQQYDLNPELVVHGKKNVSGIKFILWDQLFNRVNAVGFRETSPDYFFFFHTLLWAFIPFSIIGYIAIFHRSKEFIKIRFKKVEGKEFLSLGGFLLILFLISFSKFKLPHYLNILIPILSILTGSFLIQLANNSKSKVLKIILTIQQVIVAILLLAVIFLSFFTFELNNWVLLFISVIGMLFILYTYFKNNDAILSKIIILSVFIAAWANFNLNTLFYPKLLQYQGGLQLAEIVKKQQIPLEKIYLLKNTYNWSFDFYTKKNTKHISLENLEKKKDIWLVVDQNNYKKINEKTKIIDSIKIKHFPVTRLSGKFINKKTRDKVLTKTYLIRL